MLPKKQTPLVRAETICCTLAAVIVAICLAHHPETSWPLAVTLALLIAGFLQIHSPNFWTGNAMTNEINRCQILIIFS